ncbi:MAG: hypothetical protein AAF587_00325 [Bacteroidota bacterium]
MSLTHLHKEWIQKFLDHQLDGEELDSFKHLLEQDPEFAQEVKKRIDMVVALQAAAKMEKVLPLNQESKLIRNGWSSFFGKHTLGLALIAASLILIPVLSILWFDFEEVSYSQLADEHFERRRLNSLFTSARNHRNLPDFSLEIDSLIQHFQSLSQQDSSNASLLFTLGDLYFERKAYLRAQQAYEAGLQINAQDEFSQWNLAMTYLQINDTERAISLLHSLQQGGSKGFPMRAKIMLKALHPR